MIRFTIRDVLWLTVVVAFAICWHMERDSRMRLTLQWERAQRDLRAKAKEHGRMLEIAAKERQRTKKVLAREWSALSREGPSVVNRP